MNVSTERYQQQVTATDDAPTGITRRFAPVTADIHDTCGEENLFYKPKLQTNKLRTACAAMPRCVANELGRALDEHQNSMTRVYCINRLQQAFSDTLAGFRNLDVEVVRAKDGAKCAFIPLLPSLKLLGIAAPKKVKGKCSEMILADFCEKKLGIPYVGVVFRRDFEDCFVPARHISALVRMTQWHPVIVEEFLAWFEAFITEKVVSAPWGCMPLDAVDFFPLD